MGQRNIGNARIEHFHKGRQGNHNGDQPWIEPRLPFRIYWINGQTPSSFPFEYSKVGTTASFRLSNGPVRVLQ
jgi:hypothetical protein